MAKITDYPDGLAPQAGDYLILARSPYGAGSNYKLLASAITPSGFTSTRILFGNTDGTITQSAGLTYNSGTGVLTVNSKSLTLGGNLTTSGAFNTTLTVTGTTTVTLPTSGTLLTAATASTTITGTSNQVIASASVGPVTLSLPQSIDTAATVRFGKIGVNTSVSSGRQISVLCAPTMMVGYCAGINITGNYVCTANGDEANAMTITPGIFATGTFTGLELKTLDVSNSGMTKTGTGTIALIEGLYCDAPDIACTSNVTARFLGPSTGTSSNISVYTDNLCVGSIFYAITPPPNGARFAGSVVIGENTHNSTLDTFPFLYITTSDGPPTGVPVAYTGGIAIHYDRLNNRLYAYNGAWRYTAFAA